MRPKDPSVFEIAGPPSLPAPASEVIAALAPLLTEARRRRIEAAAARRTLDVVPVLENIADPHNTSAVLRSSDAFGIQRVHVVANERAFLGSQVVSKRTEQWLDLVRHDSAEQCIERLHAEGYPVFVAAMDGEHAPEDLATMGRVAVVFGNEHRGASEAMRSGADGTFAIPMEGFVESLNVSVAAAVTLYVLTRGAARAVEGAEREALVARYMMASVRNAEAHLAALRQRG